MILCECVYCGKRKYLMHGYTFYGYDLKMCKPSSELLTDHKWRKVK